MLLENEFLVDAPLEQTWSTLLDIQRVAQCLPGAEIESGGGDGIYRGSMQVKLGPMSLRYKGTARMAEVDEDTHSATIEVQAKELKGQGTASARIKNRLNPASRGGTEVKVQTDLNVTGRPAQFGRGIMEDVAGNMLEDFAKRLEGEVLRGNGGSPAEAAAEAAPGSSAAGGAAATGRDGQEVRSEAPRFQEPAARADQSAPAALDLGSVIARPLAKRAAAGLGVVLLLLLLRITLRGRKSGLSVTISWR